MGSVSAKESGSANKLSTDNLIQEQLEANHSHLSPARVAALIHQESSDPRSPGSSKRTPINSPNITPPANRPSSTYKERVLNRLAHSTLIDPRSPAPLRTPLSKTGAPVVRTPPPFNLSIGIDPRSPSIQMRTPLHLTQETEVVDDVVICDGAEYVSMEAAGSEEKAAAPQTPSTPTVRLHSSMELSPSPLIMALVISSPLDSPSSRKRKSAKTHLSPLKKSFSAPASDENTPHQQSIIINNTTTATTTPANNISASARARTPLSPLANSGLRYCAPIQPIKFRMDPGILG